MRREEHDRLAAEYALGLLDGEERGLAENLLASDASFQASVEQWRTRFSEWDNTAQEIQPDDALWRRIETDLNQTGIARATPAMPAQAPSSPGLLQRLWESLGFWRGVGLVGAAAAILLAIGMGFFALKASRQPVLIAVLMTDANQPGAVLRTFGDGRAELTPLGDMEIPHNHSIQVWTFPDPKGAPVSVGVVQTARTAPLRLDNLPQPHSDQLFAISIEPLAGSPTGLPTGPVVMKGTASTAL
jgi:anti-sigma-K factor RskA